MARLERFNQNPEAAQLHAAALKLEADGEFEEAHSVYSDAISTFFGESAIDQESARLQIAGIMRDEGFAYVRQAVRPEVSRPALFLEFGLEQLVSAKVWQEMLKQKGHGHFASEAWWQLRAEHGATVGMMARLSTVAYALEIQSKMKPLDLYLDAHRELTVANNRPFEMVNAISAARQMLMEGNPFSARTVWRGRAERSLDRMESEDPSNLRPAQQELARRSKFLKSPRVARNSIFRSP